ncbi:hypothetical protein DSO57_1028217 [Entomophthora muscae]|uniref:Uncharacterized protein n=1 Tax=Entomophthora muscae TaxID=34485 RepID=A0ACC2T1T1_9FUNG|nr:hypothetical protein DSO57_1028217 [Entomophthora muscae]
MKPIATKPRWLTPSCPVTSAGLLNNVSLTTWGDVIVYLRRATIRVPLIRRRLPSIGPLGRSPPGKGKCCAPVHALNVSKVPGCPIRSLTAYGSLNTPIRFIPTKGPITSAPRNFIH